MGKDCRYIALNRYVAGGAIDESIFSLETRDMPVPGEGDVLIQTLALSVDPYMRGRMTGIDTFFLSQFEIGQPVVSLGVGRVVESRHPDYAADDIVIGVLEWADYGFWKGAGQLEGGGALVKLDPAMGKYSHALGVFGLNGLTALFGILGVARPERGDTILISGAAGGIGTVAGQIARIVGARVFGIAGSQEKRDVLTGKLGFDGALDYRSPTLADDIRKLMPNGPDIYFDNVGGETSQTVMNTMRRHARIIECGQISTYDDEDGGWTVDIRPIHANGLIWESFTTAHFAEFVPGASAQLAHWVGQGKIIPLETEHQGLENAPQAMVGLLKGKNIGKMVVTIPES
jgi:NADPH-dependent curcumin reductase CurA